MSFSHLDKDGNIKMVDVSNKVLTDRLAKAEGKVFMDRTTILALKENSLPKGNVLTVAKIAGIQAAKKTSEYIPMCHQLNLSYIDITFQIKENYIFIGSIVKTNEATGVEMEALSAVSNAALTIYDMCKSVDKSMSISGVKLIKKTGGKSSYSTKYRPKVGIITLSDSIFAGSAKDESGPILSEGFKKSGCLVEYNKVMPDGSNKLIPTIKDWASKSIELILTTGGTGLGSRDFTTKTIEQIFDSKLPGVEQALHSYGYRKTKSAMLSRLSAGLMGKTIIICLPGSPGAVKDALNTLIPSIFHSFHMLRDEKH
jgi:molybdenum cofactor biosynthesis protein MoaC